MIFIMLKIDNNALVEFVEKMPAFPRSVQRVVELSSRMDSSAKEIVKVIESDPIMTVKILKVINSPFYGLPNKITSIQRALIHIGLNTIKNLALSVAAMGALNPQNKADFDMQEFLLHSIATGFICRRLAEQLAVSTLELSDYFVAGLLHDFGKVVFAEFCPELFGQALAFSTEQNTPLYWAEQEIIGVNHAVTGRMLAERWELDQQLAIAIDHHHNSIETQLGQCLFVANQVSKKLSIGFAGDPIVEPFSEQILQTFGKNLDEIIATLGNIDTIRHDSIALIMV